MKRVGVKIRRAGLEDLDGIVECQLAVWRSIEGLIPGNMWKKVKRMDSEEHRKRLRNTLSEERTAILLAEVEGKVVGTVHGSLRGGVFHLGFLGVKPGYRRRGIGLKLLKSIVDEAKRMGAHKVSLYTVPTLKEAIRLYVKEGFS